MKRQRNSRKTVIGLTGSFGTGKTTVARIFRAAGAQVIDADRIAHAVIRPGTAAWRTLVAEFGSGILKKNKTIDRARLAGAVFGYPRKVKKLNAIVHPGVIRQIGQRVGACRRQMVVIDAPLLIEAGLGASVDTLIVVRTDSQEQIKRLCKRTRLSRQALARRIRAQMPLSRKIRMADFIIDNNGTIGQTRRQVAEIIKKLRR